MSQCFSPINDQEMYVLPTWASSGITFFNDLLKRNIVSDLRYPSKDKHYTYLICVSCITYLCMCMNLKCARCSVVFQNLVYQFNSKNFLQCTVIVHDKNHPWYIIVYENCSVCWMECCFCDLSLQII